MLKIPKYYWLCRLLTCSVLYFPINVQSAGTPYLVGQIKTINATTPSKMTPTSTREELVMALHYFEFLQTLSETAITQEYQQVLREFATTDIPKNRLKLVLLLGFAPLLPHDNQYALNLLDSYLPSLPQNDKLRAYVILLRSILIERIETQRQYQLNYEAIEQKLKQREKDVQNLLEEQRIVQQKLEALKNLEKSLSDRDKILDKPPRLLEKPR